VADTLRGADFAASERRHFKDLFELEGRRVVGPLAGVFLLFAVARLLVDVFLLFVTVSHFTVSHFADSYCKAACVNFTAHPVLTPPLQVAFVDAVVKKVK